MNEDCLKNNSSSFHLYKIYLHRSLPGDLPSSFVLRAYSCKIKRTISICHRQSNSKHLLFVTTVSTFQQIHRSTSPRSARCKQVVQPVTDQTARKLQSASCVNGNVIHSNHAGNKNQLLQPAGNEQSSSPSPPIRIKELAQRAWISGSHRQQVYKLISERIIKNRSPKL